ncbi:MULTISPECIES: heavy metal translocating P-type ATPase [Chryseobacterium group]|jgi:Cd2+/Zn2+-exporting ATPase|uniref:P-type Zn(2+) transporter n=6 Tax=Chryseobacterium group TaxID=2782232 RepID=A0A1H6L243_9FLAO|nr:MULTISPECIES: heavy metal translocating P-type ATPase [Chryseobacterium group]OJX32070.1 MAG: cadmium-translocating P-type ATPase [Chryseobacterium sp. 36-9]EFK33246.1 cadmium-exporting ATPase [Chryseobacterium gleum ATCC 35910]MDN4013335.1 heavy metal translocating P-type ATPase [Chryseobacterium gambrini]MDN4028811.1 heavy metal translocating P-type ATPase [Chryseobacterium gambrini]MDO3425130.1 heavy metal translocating P-type ATPase [Chryseobacterium sp. APV1]
MKHQHTYDEQGNQLCCTPQEGKIYKDAGAKKLIVEDNGCCSTNVKKEVQHHSDDDGHNHDHDNSDKSTFQMFLPAIVSLLLLLLGIALDNYFKPDWFKDWIRIVWYAAAYAPVGLPVLKEAFESIKDGDVFSEFFLMSIATIGAFIIGEYPEGVAVMLFYAVGEVFQTLAVTRAKSNIKALLDQRPDEVTIIENNETKTIKASNAEIGQTIQLKPGEKLALDGELISDSASFNTAALTGESKPDTKNKGETVLAGMINMNSVALVKINTAYEDSKLSKILELVQNATAQKAPTELFIRRFARVYTPIVVVLAVLICLIPYFFVDNYIFRDWLYRALIFLVISCPCALVISIPLGYFGGIGAASRNGILFKGSNFLDKIAEIKNVVMDKTGTMTEGVFKVQEVDIKSEFDKNEILKMVNVVESKSTHPVATAIHEYVGDLDTSINVENSEEIAGHGLKAVINGKDILVGNFKLMDKFNIQYDVDPSKIVYTVIAIAYDKKFAGYITIADSIKDDAKKTLELLHNLNVKATMLSGDKTSVVKYVAEQIGIDNAFGDLLPEDKVNKVKEIKSKNESVAFVGDGVNDAPVVALSDVGIAMGGLGSDATIETADVVIQDDKPSKIPMAINIGKKTKRIVWQNIILAFVVKAIVLILGAGGLATMWEAVFADVGVALIAILNAVRIQRMNFK